ncbi:transcriptional regulator family: C2H2 zinc finger [Paecilomyces variotii]|uniref:C2H2-type domain-containing protein n=1 Tax=Byssochlamys spectabilis TaxID=264951 RepID=A0A443I061_BYSSP|nr:hypothetical protein C8Q69DRAFT_136530 [Paecilomyces variotii]KAJ9197045.1 transcriptional regulator family: C2H2 zinc finger [Paecilomyces variotii]KAJ9197780.1 transcriptional regulator family: C2H2 zinc finger [Paecilomyces variotii]KAJ9244177.1 transcriptional regulator family: C2H2 zinc finger [Paecilomyces variotii]KAJ9250515.1 transcriptional regulator family: C2H2 zinc finger [Paecilomyces variotii]KAJ9264554.1 transcriptional regulator family: C2H2 zinc finger [Paecilomyces varioti
MDSQDQQQQQQRARSLSTGVQNRSLSPSFPPQYQNTSSSLRIDPALTAQAFPAGTFNANPVSSAADSYNFASAYLDTPRSAEGQFAQNQGYAPSFDSGFVNQLEQPGQNTGAGEENFSNLLNSDQSSFDFSLYQNNPGEFDPSSLLDPQIQQSQSPNQSVNPADLVSAMSSPHNPTSPHHLQPDQHSSPGPASPPSSNPGNYYHRSHSRHTSLDPATAAYMTGHPQSDWQGMLGNPAFQGHRRAPSEHSEVSSVTHSPYMSQHESFDAIENNPSPLLSAQNDPTLYDNALGIESFTISEQQQHGFSPGHSPYISPQLGPQQTLDVGLDTQFLASNQLNQFPSPSTDMYLGGDGSMANMQGISAAEMGQATQMAPPSINVEFAPPSRNPSFGPGKPPADMDALSPPTIRLRGRSKSDPFGRQMTRPMTSSSLSPHLQPQASSPRSLSPLDPSPRSHSNPGSRDQSPSKSARRQSTSSLDSRSYLLDLADPQRPGAAPSDSKRTQKHPATFQCTLCPKRFTRAYNLRSHLRTHTDERPFVCTVCGKAFARQHDRKRHEGLHSGEKKFVCRGELARGGQWGCGRRFARADALGRHFRSEAGRICIKPLLDEEAHERDRVLMEQQQQQQQGHLQPVPQPMIIPGMDGQPTGGFTLPAALLAQYPALQTLQWDQIAPAAEDPNDISGRSSFDASSGGEFGYDDDDSGLNSGYNSNRGSMYGVNQGQIAYGMNDWGRAQ